MFIIRFFISRVMRQSLSFRVHKHLQDEDDIGATSRSLRKAPCINRTGELRLSPRDVVRGPGRICRIAVDPPLSNNLHSANLEKYGRKGKEGGKRGRADWSSG